MENLKSNAIPFGRPTITPEMEEAALQALRNERLVLGESVHKFEAAFARYCGVNEAVSVSSGTAALHLSLVGLGIGHGQPVLTTPMSFIATANAVKHAGAEPRFVDIDPGTLLMRTDPPKARAGPAPAALMPVHLYGTPIDVAALREAYPETPVVEDACQAHGARFRGRRAGSLGDVGCFSFYSTKNMTVAGDGGMITTNDPELAAQLRSLRDCGRRTQYLHDYIGYTSRLNTVNAAIGLVQLRHLDAWNDRRRKIAAKYIAALKDNPGVTLPSIPPGAEPVYHLFTVGVDGRDQIRSRLEQGGIQTAVHYPTPIHLQPPYMREYGYERAAFPIAESWADRTLSLPLYPDLTDEQVSRVASTVADSIPYSTPEALR